MLDMSAIDAKYSKDFFDIEKWAETLHNENFGKFFEIQNKYKESVATEKLSDGDLEVILMTLPLELFQVAEILNNFKLRVETIKMSISSKMKLKSSTDSEPNVEEDKLLLSAYQIVITRVEKEMSYSRELIMSAKKLWDSRRAALGSMPVKEKDYSHPELSDYPNNTQTYIK